MVRTFKSNILSYVLAASLVVSIGCNKEEKKETAISETSPAKDQPLAKLASPTETASSTEPLYSSLPKEIVAFFDIDFKGAAFERLLKSKWGSSYLAKTSTLTTQMPDLAAVLSEAGIDMANPAKLREQFSEALVFLSQPAQTEPHGGLILKGISEAKTQELFTAISEASKKRAGGVTASNPGEFTLLMTVNVPQGGPATDGLAQVKKVNLTGRLAGDRIIVSDHPELIGRLVSPTDKFVSADLNAAVASNKQTSIGVGYIDLKAMKENSKDKAGEDFPVKTAIISAQMSEHPSVQMKFIKEKSSVPSATTPTTKILLSSIPTGPLFYTVVEAGAIRSLATESSPKAQEVMNDTQFAFAKSISQVAFGAKVSENSESMFPIPEIIISAQTSDPKGYMDAMFNAAIGAMKGYGMPAAAVDQQIAGKSVRVLPGAMGVSLFAVDLGGVVVAATSEPLIKGAIEGSTTATGESKVSALATEALTKPAVAKLYLSFPELAKLLRTARSMASLAGASQPGAGAQMEAALSDENLKNLEDLGSLIGAVSSDNDAYKVDISYN
jgi:hypothetical protein